MRYDNLLEAISDDEPCGPDLDESGDDAYLNYVLPAADRLPARFYDRETGAPFDRASIDLKSEVAIISGLLERSRDLRLLALDARFQCLAGQIAGFGECLHAMAGLLETRWDQVHPRAEGDDYTLRQNTLAALDDRASIILPLEYAPLVRDRRIGQISLRDYRIATGQAQQREEGRQVDQGAILDAMRQGDNPSGIEAVHEAVCAAERALSSIRATFVEKAGYEYVPDFSGLAEVLGQLRALAETALPSLAGASPAELPAATDAAAPAPAGAAPGQTAMPAETEGVAIADHGAATAALLAAEHYFATAEPSSPALILVHQARILVGQPLVVALEALLPDTAHRATISIDPGRGFKLGMEKMVAITDSARNGVAAAESAAGQNFEAPDRSQAERLMRGVEAFFRRSEPSSPIPMLLAKARSFTNRDFVAILSDLVNNED